MQDAASGLCAVVAVHDTTLGPAVGGTRMRLYPTLDDATVDALRLLAGHDLQGGAGGDALGRGQGRDPRRPRAATRRGALLAAYARAVDRLGGRFHTGADMGIDGRDIAVMSRLTRYMSHTPPEAKVRHGGAGRAGRVRLHPGRRRRELGRTAGGAARRRAGRGPGRLTASRACCTRPGRASPWPTSRPRRAERAAQELRPPWWPPDAIVRRGRGRVLSQRGGRHPERRDPPPPALPGGGRRRPTSSSLEPRHGDALHARGILYGPDYVVNAGGS